jgi:hypothetical protein
MGYAVSVGSHLAVGNVVVAIPDGLWDRNLMPLMTNVALWLNVTFFFDKPAVL